MVEELRAVEHALETDVQRNTFEAGFLAGTYVTCAPLFSFKERALLIVVLAIRNVVIHVSRAKIVAIFEPSHSGLHEGFVGILPAHHTSVNELRALSPHVAPPVLKDKVSVRGSGFDAVGVVVLEVLHRSIRFVGAETVAKVHTITVNLILGEPVFEYTGEVVAGRFKAVIPVLIDVIGVRSGNVEPWVEAELCLGSAGASPRIEFIHRVETGSVVEYHIQNNGNTAFVALIDEGFELFGRAVSLIQREVVVGRVTPVVVAVKFVHRHQFNGIYAEVLEVIQSFHESGDTTFGSVVINPHLVDDEVVLVRTFEVLGIIRPVEGLFTGLDNGHITAVSTFDRITDEVGIDCAGFVFVIGVNDFLGEEVRDLFLHAVGTNHYILEAVLFAFLEAGEFNPEVVAIAFELIVVAEFPVGHITQEEDVLCG